MPVFKKLDDLPSHYLDLIRNSGIDDLFSSREWFDNYIDTVISDVDRIAIFGESTNEASDTAVLLPLYDEGRSSFMAPRKLAGLTNYYASRFEPMVANDSGPPIESIYKLASTIANDDRNWDQVSISPCRPDSNAYRKFIDAFSSLNWAVQEFRCFTNLYLSNTFSNFDTYLKTRSSRIRKTAANRTRKFDRDKSNSFRIITSVDEIEDGMALFSHLYEKRWKKTEPYSDFLPGLARLCAQNGWLRLGIVTVNGEAAAVQFWIVKDGVAYIYKVAYDEAFTKMSVGAVALFKMFEHVMDNENVRKIDFLTGDDAYKRDWMDESREMVGMVAFNKQTLRGGAAATWHLGRRAIKARLDAYSENRASK